jgi:hypothetical protein
MDFQAAHRAVEVFDVGDETVEEGPAVCEIVDESHDTVFRHYHILDSEPLM